MAILPNFEAHGYQILETLNHNSLAGRITYKTIEIKTQTLVVIKQFRFATTKDWNSYQQVEREINVLQGLNHLGIPCYLETFDSDDGICLVQEYKNAPNLSISRSFSPEEIKNIAIQLLEILIYLQNRVPTIIHRDIKPENILFDEQSKKVYLVDFGFARIGGGEVTVLSSMVMGTTGFMPPEQMLNKPLTEASDLYGLGATIICLLTGKSSTELSDLVNHEFRINYKSLVTKYSLRFINWLDLMVEPDIKKRFANAEIALKSLQPLDIIRVPEIKLDKLELEFTASCLGEKLSQTITFSNEIPDTILEGKWSVSPHPNDPPHTPDSHSWIHFSPKEFRENQVRCNITVDTSQLKADRNYDREILLESNACQEKYYLKIRVKTARFKNNLVIPPYLLLAVSCLLLAVFSGVLVQGWIWVDAESSLKAVRKGLIPLTIYGVIGGVIGGVICGAIGQVIVRAIDKVINDNFIKREYGRSDAVLYILLTSAVGILTGIGGVAGLNSYILGALATTSLPLAGMLIYPYIKQRRLKAQYRRQETKNLIEP